MRITYLPNNSRIVIRLNTKDPKPDVCHKRTGAVTWWGIHGQMKGGDEWRDVYFHILYETFNSIKWRQNDLGVYDYNIEVDLQQEYKKSSGTHPIIYGVSPVRHDADRSTGNHQVAPPPLSLSPSLPPPPVTRPGPGKINFPNPEILPKLDPGIPMPGGWRQDLLERKLALEQGRRTW